MGDALARLVGGLGFRVQGGGLRRDEGLGVLLMFAGVEGVEWYCPGRGMGRGVYDHHDVTTTDLGSVYSRR